MIEGSRNWRITWWYGWGLLIVCHHPAKFSGHRHRASGYLIILVCHVISQDNVIKGSYDFIGYPLMVSHQVCGHRYCDSGTIMLLAFGVEDFACSLLNLLLLFVSKAQGIKAHGMYWSHTSRTTTSKQDEKNFHHSVLKQGGRGKREKQDPKSIYLLKVKKINAKTMCKICSKLTKN